ncbi:MAG: Serine/threonine-protein kinase PK-1 [candidate division WS2 bacterium]|nr:Serine/threonine-protein kinase PK-1 [Candidatus Lithacetigena glycinireducens]
MNRIKIVLILIFTLLLAGCITPTEQVMVPEIEGLSLNEARQRLSQVGLSMEIKESIDLRDTSESRILSQNPRSKLLVRKGSVVYVVVRLGASAVQIPNLLGLPYKEAEITLRKSGLVVRGLLFEENDKTPSGIILKQSPSPQSVAYHGEGITLTISLGKWVEVPLLIGMTVEEAEKILKIYDLKLGIITPDELHKDKTTLIIEHFPQEGQKIPTKSMVHLKVKKGN